MIDKIELVVAFIADLEEPAPCARCCRHLFLRAGQPNHFRMQGLGEIPHGFRRIALGIYRDEDRLHIDPAFIQKVGRLGIARAVKRADIGAEGIAEIQKRWLGEHLRVGYAGAVFVGQGECAAKAARPAGHDALPALREFVAVAAALHRQKRAARHQNDCGYTSPDHHQMLVFHRLRPFCGFAALIAQSQPGINARHRANRHIGGPPVPFRLSSPSSAFATGSAPERVRLRTLILLRWLALFGQTAAVVFGLWLGIRFDVMPVLAVILISAGVNLWLSVTPPARQTENWVLMQLSFDLLQIAALLGLTGGLSNPFTLLILAPVIVAATALDGRKTALLGVATVALVTLAGAFARPLATSAGDILTVPPLLMQGHWAAIVIGVVFFGLYAHRVTVEYEATSEALFATQMALAREQRLQHLGGVVAAAAHEMGTPLATIKLVSSELANELHELLPDREDLAEDARLLRDSADRCRDILRSMGRAGKDDLLLHSAPVGAVLTEAAEPHQGRGKRIVIDAEYETEMFRDPGVIHGLRNLIQNAVDFAVTEARASAEWTADSLILTISDDGPGYPPHLLSRLGEPFLTTRGPAHAPAAAYEGMGLGLFIAKALLERSGARVSFANRREGGAQITVIWPRATIENRAARAALGENQIISD